MARSRNPPSQVDQPKKEELVEITPQCSTPGCVVWITVKIPKKLPRGFALDKPFLCGFCSQERIDHLEEELRQMKEEANAQPPSFASLFKSPIPPNVSTLSRMLKEEDKIKADRVKDIKITNPPEEDDQEALNFMTEALDVDMTGVKTTLKRIKRNEKPDILIATVGEDKKREFLKKAKLLRNTAGCEQTYISPHYTKAEEEQQFHLRQELKKRKLEHPEQDLIIRHGEIITRPTATAAGDSG